MAGCFFWGEGVHLLPMEVPRLGVKLELQLLATATAMPDPSHIFDLCCSSQQHWILNLLSKARDQTRILMDTSPVLNPLSHNRNSPFEYFCLTMSIYYFCNEKEFD